MKIGIIKEYKNPPDKRVVFSPSMCLETKKKFPEIEFFVERSDIRCFTDSEYESIGVKVVSDLSDCEVLIGVKEVPIEKLIWGKKYFFFSHTIKKQLYNKKLLQHILNLKTSTGLGYAKYLLSQQYVCSNDNNIKNASKSGLKNILYSLKERWQKL